MEYKIKRFSRTKEGLSGAWKGALGGVGLGLGIGVLGGMGTSLKDKFLLSVASSLLTVPLGAWSGYRSGVELYDARERKKQEAEKETLRHKEYEKQAAQKKKNLIEEIKKKFISKFPEILGLIKVYEEAGYKELDFGDGDEYPVFTLTEPNPGENNFVPILIISYQWNYIGVNLEKGFWCEEDKPGTKINLKQYLLKYYRSELSEYIEAKKKDSYGWEEKEYDEVIESIEKVIKSINKNLR